MTPDQVNAAVLEFLDDRIGRMGVEGSGALAYYEWRRENRVGLVSYELALFEHLKGAPAVFHVGIGFGPLIALLAANGSRCVGFEGYPGRYEGAVELKDRLRLNGGYEIRHELYPAGLREDDATEGATLLFTNLAAGADEAAQKAMIDTFGRFERVILDLRLFGQVRNEMAEREKLRTRLKRRFSMTEVFTVAGNNYFVELKPRLRHKTSR